jgi:hypothetical protein
VSHAKPDRTALLIFHQIFHQTKLSPLFVTLIGSKPSLLFITLIGTNPHHFPL